MTAYSLELRGHVTPLSPGVLLTRAHAAHTLFDRADEALLEGRISLVDDETFELAATISFGGGAALRLRSLAPGSISPTASGLRVGSAVCAIDGGSGLLATASGHVATSFVVSETGELTDHQLGLVLVEDAPTTEGRTR
jgi:hypothetical protein